MANAKHVYACITVDEELPNKNRQTINIGNVDAFQDDSYVIRIKNTNAGKTKVTVTALTYQNLKSALRWGYLRSPV